MLAELMEQGFGNTEDYNCAEKIFYGANEAYKLGLSKETLKVSAGFGGGMGIEITCGALSGAVLALSHLYVKDRAHEDTSIKILTQKLFSEFQTEMGSFNCKELKEKYRTPELKCSKIILAAAKALDTIVINQK